MIVSAAILCLALNIFHEARGELIPGQYAVALVTMNRAGGDPSRVCKEVFKPRQFSWANRGVVKVAQGWQLSSTLAPREQVSWDRAWRIAEVTLSGRMSDLTDGSTHYHTTKVRPIWRHALQPTKLIGAHQFYAAHPS